MFAATPGGNPGGGRIGTIFLRQRGNRVILTGTVSGLTPGLHGMHIHEFGSLGNGCNAAGMHFNPTNMRHGGLMDAIRHVGDLGNIVANANGVATIDITDTIISLRSGSSNDVVGRAMVIHADPDDLGRGNSPLSGTTGNSGPRVACGIIRRV
ncbi:copper/zinc superoxide dismutase [Ancylostoma caninum]|uniref:Superoxide dismutase [Cu-Zn] n=1 Tax=Ancylostoma caninum TaxID=29170 RepID=A0A368FZ77_ANCCA|nr:copper/zinc superoxide dismutase [Ancylostoma caninum]RCN37496.1 copper/zinc superoxide dismutase [Ancylostoma caninum]